MEHFDKVGCWLGFLLLHAILQSCYTSDNFFKRGKTIYVLSDFKANGNEAGQRCNKVGGQLLQFPGSFLNNDLRSFMIVKYTKGLSKVSVFQHPTDDNLRKYRLRDGHKDDENIESWRRPPKGELATFHLYPSKRENFNEEIVFCFYWNRDALCKVCDSGWKFNFILYGGSHRTPETIPLYGYYFDMPYSISTSLFLSNENIPPFFKTYTQSIYYIPDHNVFFGARSEANNTDWVWNNGKRINDVNYPSSDVGICQQMTWPVTYDDGINLYPKNCDSDLAFFICEIDFVISLSTNQCNSSTISLSWSPVSFDEIIEASHNITIEIESLYPTRKIAIVPFQTREYIITGLRQRQTYTFKATLTVDHFAGLRFESTESITTLYGLPDPTTSAKVSNSNVEENDCLIEWTHGPLESNVLFYTILTSSKNVSETATIYVPENVENATRANSTIMYNFSLTSYGYNESVIVKIRPESCKGPSRFTVATGKCISLPKPEVNDVGKNTFAIYAGGGGGLIIILLIVITILVFIKKVNIAKQKTGERMSKSTTDVKEAESISTDTEVTRSNGNNQKLPEVSQAELYLQPAWENHVPKTENIYNNDVNSTYEEIPLSCVYELPLDESIYENIDFQRRKYASNLSLWSSG